MIRRCRSCRHKETEFLPEIQKDIVYLDQFAISELYKIKSGTRRSEASHRDFWQEVAEETNKALLLQQVIFPNSNIHLDETIVSPFSSDLLLAHEMMSGDVSFLNVDEVALQQISRFAEAFFSGASQVQLDLHVDEILEGERNQWLPDLHVTTRADFSILSDRVRANRDSNAAEFEPLFDRWSYEKKTFREVLQFELTSFGSSKRGALRHAALVGSRAIDSADPLTMFEALSPPIYNEYRMLQHLLQKSGTSPDQIRTRIFEFWDWKENENLPEHRICCYLFAAIAHRLATGQKRRPSRCMMNDFKAISVYAPYVDVMFVDNECAQLLSEGPLRDELHLKARIFSIRTGNEYLNYLRDLQNRATPAVRRYAKEIYGIDS